jgi:hypothetical protein
MDIATIGELITNLGLPIAMVIAMGAFIWVIYKQSVAREDKLMTEIAENRAVNEKAIETLAVYAERLGTIENDVREIKQIITAE